MSSSADSGDRVRIVTIDDHPTTRDAIRNAAKDAMGMSVVGAAGTVEEGIETIQEHQPDVAVVDISLPDGHGFDLLKSLQDQCPDVGILVFSMYDEEVYAERVLRAGASGYVMKASTSGTLLEALREVAEGEVYLSEPMSRKVIGGLIEGQEEGPHFPIDELSERELQVFQMLGRGLTADTIAERLNLARKTVETHRRRAKEKLGCDSSEELLAFAVRWMDSQSRDSN